MPCGSVGDLRIQKPGQHFHRLGMRGLREPLEIHLLRFPFEKLDVVGILRTSGVLLGDQQVHDIRESGSIGLRGRTFPDVLEFRDSISFGRRKMSNGWVAPRIRTTPKSSI